MDLDLSLDVVDTPATDVVSWPSPEEFQEKEQILRWRDVRLGRLLILEKFNHGLDKYGGESWVFRLKHESGEEVYAYIATPIIRSIEKKRGTKFILNLGNKISETTGINFFDLKLF